MTSLTLIGELPDLVLGPLRARADSEWEHGPPGKWTPAQIVEHLALGLTLSGATFLERRHHLFVKHPRMGDLTVEEWMRFHVIHARHHAKQIRERVGK